MSPELRIIVYALIAITFLQTVALIKGVDGVMFGSSMAAIGGIIGWFFKTHKHKRASG